MPNFHYNYLAIAANEEDMRKVLTSMVNNLRTKKKLICRVDLDGYDPTEADGYSPEDLYGFIENTIECFDCLEIFTDKKKAKDCGNDGWIMSNYGGHGWLSKRGDSWIFGLSYTTAWRPNENGLDFFFEHLPEGKYGVAFCDSDEDDSYTSVNVFSGLHYGGNYMHMVDMSDDPDWIWEEGAEGPDCVEWKHSSTVGDDKFRELISARSELTDDEKNDLVKLAEWGAFDTGLLDD